MRPPSPSCLNRWQIGYSLPEVTLAIALTAFSLVVVFSLMGVGLNTLKETSEEMAQAEILNTLGMELAATPFLRLADHVSTRFPVYFGLDGEEIPTASGAVYEAACQLPDLPAPGSRTEWQRAVVSLSRVGMANPQHQRGFLLVDKGS